MKVPLVRNEFRSVWHDPPGHGYMHWLTALPFFVSPRSGMIHRVKSVTSHMKNGDVTHVSVTLWCHSSRFLQGIDQYGNIEHFGNHLTSTPDDRRPFCATCEGRAVGAGQLGSVMLAGRMVKFSPRQGRLAV